MRFFGLIGALVLWALTVCLLFGSEIEVLRDRLVADYSEGSSSSADIYLASQKPDGSWDDVDYSDTHATNWAPMKHLSRLEAMTIYFVNNGGDAVRDGVIAGIDYWFIRKPTSSNWWFNDIGQQQRLGKILLMMRPHLSSAQINTGAGYLNNPGKTGQNLVWLATQTVQRGCLKNSASDINTGLNSIKNECRISSSEGIIVDNGFHQHGALIYNGGYGRAFTSDVGYWVYMTRGLSFAFGTAPLKVYTEMVLDGTQWMVRRGRIDPSVCGREISRNNSGKSTYYLKTLDNLGSMSIPRSNEFAAMAEHVRGNNDATLSGNKCFWRSDYHVHRRADYFLSVRAVSTRNVGTEKVNNENLLAYYLPFGTNYVICDGTEYENIFPVWDWRRIPGTTTPHSNSLPPTTPKRVEGTTNFVGGVSNGSVGAHTLDLNYSSVTAKKSWFFFDEGQVALGAKITSSSANPIFTSINQCHSRSDVLVSYDGVSEQIYAGTQDELITPKWIHHDNVGYVNLNNSNMTIKNADQTGSWRKINLGKSANPVTNKIFSVWLDHGVEPSNAQYAYMTIPGVNVANLKSMLSQSPITVVSNTGSVQAVRHNVDKTTSIIYHQVTGVDIHANLRVSVNRKCALVVEEKASEIVFTVASPWQATGDILITALVNGESKNVTLTLPGSGMAGSSVQKSVAVVSSGANQAPVIDAGPAGSVEANAQHQLLASATDEDGDVLTYAWSKVSGPGVLSFQDENVLRARVQSATPGTYVLLLTVSDGINPAVSDTVSLEVTETGVNHPPTVELGADKTVRLRAGARLNAEVNDIDGDTLSFNWTKISGPGDAGTVIFSMATSEDTDVSFSEEGTYVLQLSVSDGVNEAVVDQITVHVLSSGLRIINIYASAEDGDNTAAMLLDGSLDTRWSANGDGVWVTCELDATYIIESVAMAFYNGDQRSTNFDVQLSLDGSTWSSVATSVNSSGTQLDLESFDLTENTARNLRIIGHGNSSPSNWCSITELEIYGRTPPPDAGVDVKINFQDLRTTTPIGYLVDGGLPFADRGNGWSYGWDRSSTDGLRERDVESAIEKDTLMHLWTVNAGSRIWEIQVPNGTYHVLLHCGDAVYQDHVNNILLEGTQLVDADGQDDFDIYETDIEVTDGALSLTAGAGAIHARINYIEITNAAPSAAN